jgi:aspartyl-tRNA(Asn)/glutamyl-tRNA(Gln) amidotransferase subunit B
MEIVTEPCITSAEAARRYAEELRLLLLTIGASDAAMEEGQMRVEANVSLRPRGTETLGTRVEVKNMNSFRSVERAIAFEIERQTRALDAGEKLIQETRGWDDTRGVTYTMRLKEESEDYRYFPEPDLPPLRTDAVMITAIRERMPELPGARRARYREQLGLSAYDAAVITASGGDYFDRALAVLQGVAAKRVASLYSKLALRELKTQPDLLAARDPAQLARAAQLAEAGDISSQNAEQVYARHLATGESVDTIVAELGLRQISDQSALAEIVEAVVAANPAAVADFRAGKEQALRFLTGQVMKETRGQANAALVAQLLGERLKK